MCERARERMINVVPVLTIITTSHFLTPLAYFMLSHMCTPMFAHTLRHCCRSVTPPFTKFFTHTHTITDTFGILHALSHVHTYVCTYFETLLLLSHTSIHEVFHAHTHTHTPSLTRTQGEAMVVYEDDAAAKAAIEWFNGMKYMTVCVCVQFVMFPHNL